MAIMPRFTLLLVCGLALAAVTLHSAEAGMVTAEGSSEDNIPEVLIEYPGGIFSTLVAAATAADLVGALDGAGPFTVFAPTDEAFSEFLTAAGPADTSSLTPARNQLPSTLPSCPSLVSSRA